MLRILGTATLIAAVVTSALSARQSDSVSVELPEAVELAMIVAVVSDLDPEGRMIEREGEYVQAIEAHFAPHADHPLFAALDDSFNLPRLAGNAADFAFDETGNLIEVDTSGSIWGDSDGDIFRAHLELLNDFAAQSDFLGFYQSHQALYQRGISDMRAQTDSEAMTAWLEANFTARPGPMQIIVSPLIGGLNWTTIFKPRTRMWVAQPSGGAPIFEKSNYDRVVDGYAVFTELDHSYVNPATTEILDRVEAGFSNLDVWATPQTSALAYRTAELQFNEYMTWAVYLMYAADQLPPEEFAQLKDRFVSFMVDQRGFRAFGDFADVALDHFAEGELTAEQIMPVMAAWGEGYASPAD